MELLSMWGGPVYCLRSASGLWYNVRTNEWQVDATEACVMKQDTAHKRWLRTPGSVLYRTTLTPTQELRGQHD